MKARRVSEGTSCVQTPCRPVRDEIIRYLLKTRFLAHASGYHVHGIFARRCDEHSHSLKNAIICRWNHRMLQGLK